MPSDERIQTLQQHLCAPGALIAYLADLSARVASLEEQRAALCDAIQWIGNRGPDKVPYELMEKLKEWGT